MVAKLQRKASPRRTVRPASRARKSKAAPTDSSRGSDIGRMIALGSMVAAGLLVVMGVGAIALLASEPSRRSGKWGGWNINDLSNAARERLRANIPQDWRRTVREDFIPEARDFMVRQTRRFS